MSWTREPRVTPNLGLPIPGDNSPADFVNDVGAIADRLDQNANIVATLPSNPSNGQTVYFQNAAMANSGTVWQFRYRSTATGGYPWESVGGPPWCSHNQVSTTNIPTGNPGTIGPSIPAPLPGFYHIHLSSYMSLDGVPSGGVNGVAVWVGLMAGGVELLNVYGGLYTAVGGFALHQYHHSVQQVQVPTGTAMQLQIQRFGGLSSSSASTSVFLQPIRVTG